MISVIILKVSNQFMKNFSYLVVDADSSKAVIVDPAWEIEIIEHALDDMHAELSGILLTHSHLDHTHLAKPLADRYKCPIWMSKEEIAVSGFNATQLIGVVAGQWKIGKIEIEAILTPGHTAGSLCYLIGENLFTGDTLFAEGCGTCLDTQAAYAMFTSLQKLKVRLAPNTRIYPGHSYGKFPGSPLSQLLTDNIYLQFIDKYSFASFRLRSGQDLVKMFAFT